MLICTPGIFLFKIKIKETMKKRITYEIHGQIERNCYFRIGKALVRIEFAGGSINSTGVYPAYYVTENALFQKAIENSDIFRNGEIKRGKIEIIKEPCDVTEQNGGSSVEAQENVKSYPEVANMGYAFSSRRRWNSIPAKECCAPKSSGVTDTIIALFALLPSRPL